MIQKHFLSNLLYIFVKSKHASAVSELQYDSAPVGILGSVGNKGGMGARFRIYDTTICAVNSHLNSRTEDVARRNQDYRDISSRLSFSSNSSSNNSSNNVNSPETAQSSSSSIFEHDVIIWLGDLNYRINMPDAEIRTLISQRAITDLLGHDQLKEEMLSGGCFEGFSEAPISFAPTYRFDKKMPTYVTPATSQANISDDVSRTVAVVAGEGSDDASGCCCCSPQRSSPAWCDRVLWRVRAGHCGPVAPLQYARRELAGSAHRPVSLVLLVSVKTVIPDARANVYKDVVRQLDAEENAAIPDTTVSATTLDFGSVGYMTPQTQVVTLRNSGGRVPARWRFIPKPNEASAHKAWVSLAPADGVLMPGQAAEIRVTVLVDSKSAAALNAREEALDDLLVLHLDRGKDHFISVRGSFLRTCFGMSLDLLSRYPHPVRSTLPISEANAEDRLALPKEVWRIVDYIYLCGMDTPGIFAQSGSADMAAIRECLDTGAPFTLHSFGVHSMAEVLVRFLEALSEPVIPYALYQQCLDAAASYQAARRIVSTQLTAVHYNTFYYLMSFLQELLGHKDKNGLSQERLVYLFSSVLLRSPDPKAKLTEEVVRKKVMFVNNFVSIK